MQIFIFPHMRFHESVFFQNLVNSRTLLNNVVPTTLWPQTFFFFSLYIFFLLSHPTLLLLCRKNMKYLSGHRVLKAQLLHGNVAGIRDNCLQWWAKTTSLWKWFLCFRETRRHKFGFLLTFGGRWIWFLWRSSFTSNWFKMRLLSSQMWISKLVHSGEWFLFYLCLWANLL